MQGRGLAGQILRATLARVRGHGTTGVIYCVPDLLSYVVRSYVHGGERNEHCVQYQYAKLGSDARQSMSTNTAGAHANEEMVIHSMLRPQVHHAAPLHQPDIGSSSERQKASDGASGSESDDLLFSDDAAFPVEAFGAYSSIPTVVLDDVAPSKSITLHQRFLDDGPSVLLWNSAVSLARQWQCGGVPPPAGQRVLDLGAGLGLCAICAAAHGAKEVVATELQGPALDALQQSALANATVASASLLRVVELEWGERKEAQTLGTEPFDVVICADLIYNRELHAPLLRTLEAVITQGVTTLLLVFERRGHEVDAFLTSSEIAFGAPLKHARDVVGPDERNVEILALSRLPVASGVVRTEEVS